MSAPYLDEPIINWPAIFAAGEDDLKITYGEWAGLSDEEKKLHPVTAMKQAVSDAWVRHEAKRIVEENTHDSLPFIVSTEADILDRPSPKWLVDGLIQESTICLLAGPGGVGKSFMALSIARAIATGNPFFQRATTKGRTLYVIAEGAAAFGDRVRAWNHVHSLPSWRVPDDAITYVEQGVNLKDPTSVATLGEMVREGGYSLVILDTLSQLGHIENENAAGEISTVFRAILGIRSARPGTSVLVLDHTPMQGGKPRGSTAKRDNSDTVIMAIPVGDTFTLSTVNADGGKQKDGVEVEWHGFHLQPALNSAVLSNNGGKRPRSPFWEMCLPILKDGKAHSSTELKEACGIEGDMRSAEGKRLANELTYWTREGLVSKSGSKTRPTYTLTPIPGEVTE